MGQSKMPFSPLAIAIQRPVAVSMFFLAIAFLGTFSWFRIPVELVPAFSGEQLYVRYYRPGAEPEVIEREILAPLESRIAQLPGVTKTSGEITGSTGSLNIEFEPGSNYRIRELELRRIAAELARSQPEGTRIRVSSQDTTAISRFVMSVQIVGGDDSNTLRDLVEERIQPRLEALEGVSQVFIFGGASKEVSVWLDAGRCAELGVKVSQASAALRRAVGGLRYLGSAEGEQQRLSVVIDGRPGSLADLGEIRIVPELPVLLRHVAEIEMATAPQESVSRVNGQAAVSLVVFKEQGSNLVRLGQHLRAKLEALDAQFNPYGVELVISFDAAEKVDEQLHHLKQLAASGFLIALLVLFLFLKELRAVAVVAIAVPMSLLTAGALLYLSGYSLNLITLFGLVIGVGMLVDNSIVVYEAVQRNLERGIEADAAALGGIRRTIRAIITASATNAIVFLPLIYLQEIPLTIRQVLENIVPAILFPLAASLLVAIGLVPLLTQRLAAPAALARIQRNADRRLSFDGAMPPQLARELFSAVLKVALRRPAPWVIGTLVAILLSVVIALPWVMVQSISQPPAEADEVRIEVEFDGGGSLEAAGLVFERLEQAALDLDGVARVESNYQETQGSLTIHLAPLETRPETVNAARVRQAVNGAVNGMGNVQLQPLNAGGSDNGAGSSSNILAGGASQIAISGPDMAQLSRLAEHIKQQLIAIPQISGASVSSRKSLAELHIQTNPSSLAAHRLEPSDALGPLVAIGREGQRMPLGFNLANGREVPMVVRRTDPGELKAGERIVSQPVLSEHGVLSLGELVETRQGVPPLAIVHRNGRRALQVNYRLSEDAPKTGPGRMALERQIAAVVNRTYTPEGYTIEVKGGGESTDWFKVIAIPIVFLLYALLAVAFESLTLPLLVLVTVPLTVFGAIWALFVTGLGVDMMAVIGVVVLLGLTVNPAILLVDRMQQKLRISRCSGGVAAMTAVRERVRPVLMTSCTTIAGLWPLALAKGQELEVWPPFATVVMGGLVTSTLLTLLIIPIGFVMLSKIDRAIAQIGPWKLMLWGAATSLIMVPLILSEQLVSLAWQIISTGFIAGGLFWILVRINYRQPAVAIDTSNMVVETRYLSKVYGQPGPVGKAWQRWRAFSRQHNVRGVQEVRERALIFALSGAASVYLAVSLQTLFWRIGFTFLAGALLSRLLIETGRLLWPVNRPVPNPSTDNTSINHAPPVERWILTLAPWIVLVIVLVFYTLLPRLNGQAQPLFPGVVLAFALLTLMLQSGRRSAASIVSGLMPVKVGAGRFAGIRSRWRAFCLRFFALDLPGQAFTALSSMNFRAEAGMIGILGPNGAGKTTLFRLLASVLGPSVGTIHYANVEKRTIGSKLARLIGYLPQEFGLPGHLTGREYLHYFALLYEVGDKAERKSRVEQLLVDVGLEQKQDEKISAYSGGMRQRVAVARTLLRQPPLILVDEPTAGLDPRERIRFRNLLAKLSEGRVVLFSTHVVEDVAVSCDRVVVMKTGAIVFDGEPDALADLAQGKIWQVKLPQEQARQFEKQHNVINQLPEQGDKVNLRVLAGRKPHEQAELLESTLEDGYFQLFYGAKTDNG